MFEEAHENLEGLRKVFAGQAPPIEAERAAAHLATCRECWLLAIRAMAAERAQGGIVVEGPLQSLIDIYEMERARLEEGLEARAVWAEIRSLATKARRDKVRLTRTLHTANFLNAP